MYDEKNELDVHILGWLNLKIYCKMKKINLEKAMFSMVVALIHLGCYNKILKTE